MTGPVEHGTDAASEIATLRAELDAIKSSLVAEGLATALPWPLSPHERRIFGMLLASDVVSKKTIVALVHGRTASKSDLKNIDVFISRIRAKTASHGVNIETIFGVGYRLDGRESWRTAIQSGACARH